MNTKVYDAVKSGTADNNISFTDFQNLIVDLGFEYQRQEGSHMIYRHKKHRVIMNIQRDGNKAKDYQVRQLRNIIKKYSL
ncbi:MAG: type II toxin-antitoxin system HicA family toxin [Lachnospiraceae bacterium]|nr:type II toxin-antitoxin system HicA family toxin [Lachnospiraceae bacterium]